MNAVVNSLFAAGAVLIVVGIHWLFALAGEPRSVWLLETLGLM